MAKLNQPELLQHSVKGLDRNFKNVLQDSNLQFTLIYKNASQEPVIFNLEAPSFTDGSYWDICFFANPHIIETNLMLTKQPKAELFFSYYKKFMIFTKNRKF